MKVPRLVVVFCTLVVCSLTLTSPVAPQEDEPVHFIWGFWAFPTGALKKRAITQDTTLRTGDRFKMAVELKKPCYVYVIYYGGSSTLNRGLCTSAS